MQIYNEYVHIDKIVKQESGRYIVRYEPTEHKIAWGTLAGQAQLVISDRVINFHCSPRIGQRSPYNCHIEAHPHDDNWLMSGFLGPDRMLKLVWDVYPGDEHFLCIHYETPNVKDTYKTNWLQEGF